MCRSCIPLDLSCSVNLSLFGLVFTCVLCVWCVLTPSFLVALKLLCLVCLCTVLCYFVRCVLTLVPQPSFFSRRVLFVRFFTSHSVVVAEFPRYYSFFHGDGWQTGRPQFLSGEGGGEGGLRYSKPLPVSVSLCALCNRSVDAFNHVVVHLGDKWRRS